MFWDVFSHLTAPPFTQTIRSRNPPPSPRVLVWAGGWGGQKSKKSENQCENQSYLLLFIIYIVEKTYFRKLFFGKTCFFPNFRIRGHIPEKPPPLCSKSPEHKGGFLRVAGWWSWGPSRIDRQMTQEMLENDVFFSRASRAGEKIHVGWFYP